MRKILLLFLFVGFIANAQKDKESKSNLFYLSSSYDIGNYKGAGFDLSFIYKEKTSFSLGILPTEYSIDDNLNISENPGTALHLYFTGGRIINFKKTKKVRLNLSGGFVTTFFREVKVFESAEANNQTHDYRNIDIGLVLNPKIEFPLSTFIGLQISPKVILNKYKSFYGVGFGLMLGKLRKR